MVAAERASVLGPLLCPIVTRFPFLWSDDTRKDAIDLIGATYPLVSAKERLAFEVEVFAFDFSGATDPQNFRSRLLTRLFTRIGPDLISTETAGIFVANKEEAPDSARANDRLVSFSFGSGLVEEYWWLENQKVDVKQPTNAAILNRAKAFKEAYSGAANERPNKLAAESVSELTAYLDDFDRLRDGSPLAKIHAVGIGAESLETIASRFEKQLARNPNIVTQLIPGAKS